MKQREQRDQEKSMAYKLFIFCLPSSTESFVLRNYKVDKNKQSQKDSKRRMGMLCAYSPVLCCTGKFKARGVNLHTSQARSVLLIKYTVISFEFTINLTGLK